MSKISVLLVQRGISSQTHAVSGKSLKSYGFATQVPGHGVALKMSLEEYAACAHDIVGNTQPQQQWVPEFILEVNAPKDRGKCCIPAGCPNEADYRSGVDLYCSGHAPNDAEPLYDGAPAIGTFPMGKAPASAADVLQTVNERPSLVEKGVVDAPVERITPNVGSQMEADSAAKPPTAAGIDKPEPIPAYVSPNKTATAPAPAGTQEAPPPASFEAAPEKTTPSTANAIDAVATEVMNRLAPTITALTDALSNLPRPAKAKKRQVKPAAGGEQAALRAEAKGLGINIFQKSNDELKRLIAIAKNPPE